MSQQTPKLTAEETAKRGDAIYEQQIRSQVEAANQGKVVAIDVDSGDFAIGDTALAAASLLRTRRPDAEIWFVRVGHAALHRIGRKRIRESS
ncbi:MAG: hypothetical protein HY000_04730 [Planctomycetes bacterium]|nr:hypothetical protein [Planctomycetota bacterium]